MSDGQPELWDLDLGDDHRLRYVGWYPDREINPQWKHVPDVERWGATIAHRDPATGDECQGFVTFDGEIQRQVEPNRTNRWQVESWDPLTLSGSVQCGACADHGWVRSGRWQRA